ncbi:hypothetical protein FQN54_005931 [Arachnomyces sp. PD_36]|nr:hypothetical protein FQN54_005931 [Arachnomyces sp. PD_36]
MDLYFSSREKNLASWLVFTWVSIRSGAILWKITRKFFRDARAHRHLRRRSSPDAAPGFQSSSANARNNRNAAPNPLTPQQEPPTIREVL